MNRLFVPVALALGIASGLASAGPRSNEVFFVEGRVIRAEPVYETTWYYDSREHERCRVREVEVHRPVKNAGPAGAIIGGAIGAQVGAHAGNSTESTVAGAIAGSVIGGVIGQGVREQGSVHYRVERDCSPGYRREHRELIGYDVRYRYNGREFSIHTHDHPGRYIQLRVEVQPAVR